MKTEILKASYWEHFKFAKELALILPIEHHQRIRIENELNFIQQQLNENKT